jgi:hypothetical protein
VDPHSIQAKNQAFFVLIRVGMHFPSLTRRASVKKSQPHCPPPLTDTAHHRFLGSPVNPVNLTFKKPQAAAKSKATCIPALLKPGASGSVFVDG